MLDEAAKRFRYDRNERDDHAGMQLVGGETPRRMLAALLRIEDQNTILIGLFTEIRDALTSDPDADPIASANSGKPPRNKGGRPRKTDTQPDV